MSAYPAAYLRSEHWMHMRAVYEADELAPHACVVCGAPRYQLHHRTYERCPGAELVADLIALCSEHHHALHRAWTTHQRYRPGDSLATFTDAWVLIKRRGFSTAPLPGLDLYRRPRAGALAGASDECPMCGWTVGTNPTSCGECAEHGLPLPERHRDPGPDRLARPGRGADLPAEPVT